MLSLNSGETVERRIAETGDDPCEMCVYREEMPGGDAKCTAPSAKSRHCLQMAREGIAIVYEAEVKFKDEAKEK